MRVLSFFLFSLVSFGTTSALQLHEMTGTQWAPYAEWEFENDSFEGNPFDIIAKATFLHEGSGETLTTELFYNGDYTWKLRFCGTKPGRWSFRTESRDEDLDDLERRTAEDKNLSDEQDGKTD
jgi:hypothetical protein